MKFPVLALAATIGLALPALAETSAPVAPAPTAPVAAAPAPGSPDAPPPPAEGKGKAKEIRQACRAQIKGQGLKGEDKMKAVSDCVVKERPDLAQREQCRLEGWGKGLRKQELKEFVKDCAKAKG